MITVDTERTQSDFDIRQLDIELREASIDGFYRVDPGGETLHLNFEDEATQEAIDAALAVIDAHVPGSRNVKLYRYLNSNADLLAAPQEVDYISGITQRLHHRNSVIVSGEIRRVDYYANAEQDQDTGFVTYDDLILREDFVYARDALGFARSRTQTITWFREDGEPHPDTKTRLKLYETDESIVEGQRRRKKIFDCLSGKISAWLVGTMTQFDDEQDRIDMGREFLRFHKTSFDMFSEASSAQVLYDIRDDVEAGHAWIDEFYSAGVTVRAFMLSRLDIWNLNL